MVKLFGIKSKLRFEDFDRKNCHRKTMSDLNLQSGDNFIQINNNVNVLAR